MAPTGTGCSPWAQVSQSRLQPPSPVVLSVGVGALGVFEIYNVTSESRDSSNGLVHVSVGSGLYVLLLGAGLAVVASVLHIGFKVSR